MSAPGIGGTILINQENPLPVVVTNPSPFPSAPIPVDIINPPATQKPGIGGFYGGVTGPSGTFEPIMPTIPSLIVNAAQLINKAASPLFIADNPTGLNAVQIPAASPNFSPTFNFGNVDLGKFFIASSVNGAAYIIYREAAQ